MRKAPSTLAATTILAVFLCLGSAQVSAQCNYCIGTTDATCSGTYDDCSVSTTGCSSTATFTPPCTGTYKLGAKVSGAGCVDCDLCSACVLVVIESTGVIVNSYESGCTVQFCTLDTDVTLNANITYRLYVCKRPCEEAECTTDCKSACIATGWISRNVTTCP